jgi:hypothetical protein
MARSAGINMPDCRLLEENGLAHFMIKRFCAKCKPRRNKQRGQ